MISHCKLFYPNVFRYKNILSVLVLLTGSSLIAQDFTENFDDSGVTAPSGTAWALPDSGTWQVFDNGIGPLQNWTLNIEGTYPANSQPKAAYINRENIGDGNTSRDFLATPLITFQPNPQLRFKTRTTLQPDNGTIFEIRAAPASSDPALPESYTTLITSWTENNLNENYDTYEEKIVNLNLPEASMYLAFVKVATQVGTAIGGDRWLIDDVVITGECLNVQNLTAIPADTSALLSWDSPGPASEWYVHVLPADVSVTDPTVGLPLLADAENANEGYTVSLTTLAVPVTLLPGTEYVFWIMAACEYETGEWISSGIFTTETLPATCGGNYIDDGGLEGNYAPDTNTITTICPEPGEVVTVTFTDFDIEAGFDGIYVYDGDSTDAPMIMSENGVGYGNMTVPGAFWGNEIPGPFTSSSPDGCLTFKFISSGSINNAGFAANILCSPAPACQKPTAVTAVPLGTESISVSWIPVGAATGWLVYAIPCDSPVPDPGTPGGILTNDVTLVIDNLASAACYDIIVFSVCDGGTYSTATLPQMAATLVPEPVCGGTFQDPAGALDYAQNTDYTVTICPDEANGIVVVEFLEFDIQQNFDGMYVYDGDSTDAPQFNSGNTGGWLPNILEPGAYWGTQLPGPFTATSESGCLTFHFMSNNDFNGAGWLANVVCQEAPPCPQPTALSVGLPLPTKATIEWTNVGPATEWEVIAVLCGSPVPDASAEGVQALQIPFQYTGLAPDTCYDFYVRGNCTNTGNGISAWAGPVSLTTEPAPPACNEIFTDEGGDENYPEISESVVTIYPDTPGDIVTVIFTAFALHSEDDVLYVYDGPTTSSPQIASSNGPGYWQYPNVQLPGGFWGTEIPGPFEATNPEGCLTFEFKSNNTNAWAPTSMEGWTAYVVCSPAPTCAKPTDVIVTEVTQTSVTVDWTEEGTASDWQVLVLPYSDPFPNPDAAGWQAADAKPYTFAPLIPGLPYKVYVRAVCATDDISTWSYYADFHTLISNDFCEGAIDVPVNPDANCSEVASGTFYGATASGISSGDIYPCIGNDNVDMWFRFTAVESEHYITMNYNAAGGVPSASSPPFALFSGDCESGLTFMACYSGPVNATFPHIVAQSLLPGETYYIQVFSQQASESNFNICVGTIPEVIAVSEDFTTEQLIQDILFDSTCAIITNITSSTGVDFDSVNGIGYFNRSDSDFPFAEGIVLSTGYVANVPGPNNTYLADGAEPSENGLPLWTGDTDLETIILEGTGTPLFSLNSTKIEFDFVPVIPTINFNFIFASDEYGYYQCSFSDSFAFILTDLSDPEAEPVNLATVPNTGTPISVVTIRDMAFNSACDAQNPEYFGDYYAEFFNNSDQFLPDGKPSMSAPVNFYGMTVPLTAFANVIPGHLYHIKLVIADRADYAMDSAVFIEAGSFDIGSINLGSDLLMADGTAVCGESYVIATGLSEDSYSFVWTEDGEILPGETDASITVTENGSYGVTALYNNSECSTTDMVIIEFYAPGILNPLEDITQCNSYTFPTPAIGHYYAQQGGQGAVLDLTTTTIVGEQTVYQYYSSGPECTEEVSFILTITENFELEPIGDVYSCGTYDLPEIPGVLYYTGPGASGSQITSVAATQSVYAYLAGDTPACSAEQNFMVFITDLPKLEIIGGCVGNEYILEVNILNATDMDYSYTWSNEGGDIISANNAAMITVSGEGLYSVIVAGNDCENSAEKQVFGTLCMIQRGISPNGDDMNDYFDLAGMDVQKLQIFNRYGMIVYERSPYSNEWNGLSESGQQLPDGTYFYVIEFGAGKEPKTGWIYIVRED